MGYCYTRDGREVVVEDLSDTEFEKHRKENGCSGDCYHCALYMADE